MIAFKDWLANAAPGSRFTYHIGDMRRGPNTDDALTAYKKGRVELVQRRVDDGFEYIAVKRKQVLPPAPWANLDINPPTWRYTAERAHGHADAIAAYWRKRAYPDVQVWVEEDDTGFIIRSNLKNGLPT